MRLRLLRGCRGSRLVAAGAFLSGLLNLAFDRSGVHSSQLEAFYNAVDLTGILSPDHHIYHAVRELILAAQGAIDHAIPLGFGGKLLQMFLADSKHLQFFSAFQHGGEPLAASDLVLIPIFQNGINGSGNVFGGGTGEL